MAALVIFCVGVIVQACTQSVSYVFAGRFVTGLGVGALSMVVPLYNAELAPPEVRGFLVALQQFAITFGIMTSFWVCIRPSLDRFSWLTRCSDCIRLRLYRRYRCPAIGCRLTYPHLPAIEPSSDPRRWHVALHAPVTSSPYESRPRRKMFADPRQAAQRLC